MPTGIQLSSGVVVGQPIPLDAKFGPYNSTADALNDIGVGLRYRGLTVGVYESGVLKEYWFKDGTGNEHFVAKSSDVTWDSLQDKPAVFPPDTHYHAISEVTGLQTALDGKQAAGSYAPADHDHAISDVTGLQTALDAKEDEPFLFTVTQDNQTIPTGHRLVRVVAEVPPGGGDWTLNLPSTGALKGDTVYVETLRVGGSGQSLTLVSTPTDSYISVGTVVLGSYETLVARFNGFAWSQVTRDTFVSPVGRNLQIVNTLTGLTLSGDLLAVDPVDPKTFVTVINENLPEADYAFPDARNIRLNATIAPTNSVSLRLPQASSRQLYDRIEVWLVGQAEPDDAIIIRRGGGNDGSAVLATLNTIGQAAAFILEPSGWQLYPVSQHTHPDATTTAAGFLSTADKTKLDGIADGAEVNVNADWNATSGDAQILNKPSTFPPSSHTHTASEISDSTAAGRALLTAADAQAQREAIDLFFLSANRASFPSTGQVERAYIAADTGKVYAWSNNTYIELSPFPPVELVIACSDETSNLTVGANKVTFRSPYAFTLTGVRASVNTAPTGAPILADVNVNGTSVILHVTDIQQTVTYSSLRIDSNTKSSLASGQPTILVTANTAVANDAEITIDIDQVGSSISGKGLKVVLIGTRA